MSNPVLTRVLRSCLGLLFAAALTSCGGGGVVPGTVDAKAIRTLPTEYLTRNAVAYSPYRTANFQTETPTVGQITQDLTLLAQGNFTLIRLFDSSDKVAKQTLQIIKNNNLDIKVHLGCWISSTKYAAPADVPAIENANQLEIARCIALANAYPDLVLVVSVGNECMVSWTGNPVSPAQMTSYITQVRSAITQPVTTDDNYAFFASAPTYLLNTLDFVSIHSYALLDTLYGEPWDWKQTDVPATGRAAAMMGAAIAFAQQNYNEARTYLDKTGYAALPIVIGETGWKAVPTGGEYERAHPVNQQIFFNLLNAWRISGTGPKNIFWFEAFDEPWKGGDDGWGLFNVGRQARFVVRGLYPAATWEPGTYTTADALHYVPTVQNPAVSASRFTLFAETATTGEALPAAPLSWGTWTWSTSAVPTTTTAAEGTTSMQITPGPFSWGWGTAFGYTKHTDDLSAFAASGYLNFSIKTTYPGTILVGFQTGNPVDLTLYNVFLPLAPGNHGYFNDGAWHDVKIPISALTPWGAMGSGMPLASLSKLDMTMVSNPFVVADVFSSTGKPAYSNPTNPIYIDRVFWSK